MMRRTKFLKVLSACFLLVFLQACASIGAGSSRRSDGGFREADYETAQQAVLYHNVSGTKDALFPGDLVRVNFVFAPELNVEQRVLKSGHISLPYEGLVKVIDKSVPQIMRELRRRYRNHLQQPDLTLTVAEYANPIEPPQIYIIGAVEEGGAFDIRRPVTFLEAMALAGGPTEAASRKHVAVIRVIGNKFVAKVIDPRDIFALKTKNNDKKGKRKQNLRASFLKPGDIVYVPKSKLASAAEISTQIQQLLGINGISASLGYELDNNPGFF